MMARANDETLLAVKLAEHCYKQTPYSRGDPNAFRDLYYFLPERIASDAASFGSMARSLRRMHKVARKRALNGWEVEHVENVIAAISQRATEYGLQVRVVFNNKSEECPVILIFPDGGEVGI